MEFIAQDIREKVDIQLQIYLIHFIIEIDILSFLVPKAQ